MENLRNGNPSSSTLSLSSYICLIVLFGRNFRRFARKFSQLSLFTENCSKITIFHLFLSSGGFTCSDSFLRYLVIKIWRYFCWLETSCWQVEIKNRIKSSTRPPTPTGKSFHNYYPDFLYHFVVNFPFGGFSKFLEIFKIFEGALLGLWGPRRGPTPSAQG